MDDSEPLTAAEAEFLAALERAGVRYLVVGMSAALIQGVRGSTEDVDIWFESLADPALSTAALHAGGFLVTRSQPPLLGGFSSRFDVVTHMSGLATFTEEYEHSSWFDLGTTRVRVLALDRVLASKRAAARPKDRLAIEQIEQAMLLASAIDDEKQRGG